MPAIVSEAVLGATYGVLYERVRSQGPETLPEIAPLLSYLALAPFMTAEEAYAVATSNGRTGAR